MNADPVASLYRWMEYLAFGRALERCRLSLLDAAAGSRRMLILGEGDGRFLVELLARNPQAEVDVVDSSGRMLELARGRIPQEDARRVRFHHRNALEGLPEGNFDTVVTNFFLDCLTEGEAASLIPRIAAQLEAEGQWLIGDFHLPPHGLRRLHAQIWLKTMYLFFAVTTGLRARHIPDYPRSLTELGLTRKSQRWWRWELITSEVWRSSYRR